MVKSKMNAKSDKAETKFKDLNIIKLKKGETVTFCTDIENANQLTAKDVAEAANNGDPVANEIIRISGEYLGRGLAVLIDILNPECIVIGSIYSRSVFSRVILENNMINKQC